MKFVISAAKSETLFLARLASVSGGSSMTLNSGSPFAAAQRPSSAIVASPIARRGVLMMRVSDTLSAGLTSVRR